jgi:hypothetical protein
MQAELPAEAARIRTAVVLPLTPMLPAACARRYALAAASSINYRHRLLP